MNTEDVEWFHRPPPGSDGSAFVRVCKNGYLYINATAMEMIGDPSRVALFYDAKQRALGIQAAENLEPDAFSAVRVPGSRHATLVAFRGFTRYYGLRPLQGKRRPAQVIGGRLVVDLSDGGAA